MNFNKSCYIYNTKSDGLNPSDFHSNYHVHILCREGMMSFSNGRKNYTSAKDDLVIWQMSNTIQNVSYSEDFNADFLIVSPNFLSHFNPEMTWATQGFIFIRMNPSYHLTDNALRTIENDFHQFKLRLAADDEMFKIELLGRQMQIFLYDLWIIYSKGITEMNANDNSSLIFLRFISLVQQHCKKNRDVAFFADLICITPKYLSQVSNKVTNVPASEWINYYATSELVTLLNDNSKTFTQIADEMNFSTMSFFSRYVKKMLGITPSQFRSGR